MMNLADPELELIDPTPNVHCMFLHFDKTFFWEKLSSRCVVRWSKRMYSCAGICSYEGRGGVCDIALSEPLLKLRPRKDLVETLLHEMIHAFLFVTRKDQDRDGHGPNFQAHMHRINRAAGLNISIYHDFHDEVELYQTHWWRCDGPCQKRGPYFGIVRRTCNRAPGPSDYWWNSHKRNCGGTFIKIKEPEKPVKEPKGKKTKVAKPNEDITKYINNNNNKDCSNKNISQKDIPKKPVLKDTSNIPSKSNVGVKSNNSNTLVVTKKNVVFNPQVPSQKPKPVIFSGSGQTLGEHKSPSDVVETVRNVWANKQLGTNNKKDISKNSTTILNSNKHKADTQIKSPPQKIKKIDDYFKSTANSLLKGIYGQDLVIKQSTNNEKFIAVSNDTKTSNDKLISESNDAKTSDKKFVAVSTDAKKIDEDLVSCPVCCSKIKSSEINRHLDECLNKSVIGDLCNETQPKDKALSNNDCSTENKSKAKSKIPLPSSNNAVVNNVKQDPDYIIDLSDIEFVNEVNRKRSRTTFDQGDLIKSEPKKSNTKLRKSDSFIGTERLTAIKNEEIANNLPIIVESSIKIEPGCSKTNGNIEPECPCCGDKLNTTVDEHLEECLSFFDSNTTIPEEGASTSFSNETIVIDDDDAFDETLTMNATGTKLPCPCCLKMVEVADMNKHLDVCLS